MIAGHLFVTDCIFLEYLDEILTIDIGVEFGQVEVLAEEHEFIDGHDGCFMHDLLECWVLPCCVAHFAIVLEDNLNVLFVSS